MSIGYMQCQSPLKVVQTLDSLTLQFIAKHIPLSTKQACHVRAPPPIRKRLAQELKLKTHLISKGNATGGTWNAFQLKVAAIPT